MIDVSPLARRGAMCVQQPREMVAGVRGPIGVEDVAGVRSDGA